MNLIAQTVAKSYSPATQQAQAAATEFVAAATAWGERFKTAQDNLHEFVRANVHDLRRTFAQSGDGGQSVFGNRQNDGSLVVVGCSFGLFKKLFCVHGV